MFYIFYYKKKSDIFYEFFKYKNFPNINSKKKIYRRSASLKLTLKFVVFLLDKKYDIKNGDH